MCAAHILRQSAHVQNVHTVYKIRAACIFFVSVHIVTYAGCMCANCKLSAHFILCTDSRTCVSELYIYIPNKNYILRL